MPSDSVKKAEAQKNVHAKSIIFKKKIVHQLGFELPTSYLRVSCSINCTIYVPCGLQRNVALLLRLQPVAERKLNAVWTGGDKLEVGRQWVYGVKQLKCRCRQFQASYRCYRQSERQTQKLSFIYREQIEIIGIVTIILSWIEYF